MKRMILTVGLPRSGKSTWARKQGFPIVSSDSVRMAWFGSLQVESRREPLVWATAYAMVTALLDNHDNVIIDATNTTLWMREQWIKRFPDVRIEYKIFDTSRDECVKRAKETGKEYLIPIIDRQANNYDTEGTAGFLYVD